MFNADLLKDVHFRLSTFEKLQQSAPGILAKRDGLSFKDTQKTQWIEMLLDNEIVGVCGLIHVRDGVVRLKSSYILQEWRHQGIVSYCTVWCMKLAVMAGYKKIIGIARPISKQARLELGWHETPGAKKNHIEYDLTNPELLATDDILQLTIDLRHKYGQKTLP